MGARHWPEQGQTVDPVLRWRGVMRVVELVDHQLSEFRTLVVLKAVGKPLLATLGAPQHRHLVDQHWYPSLPEDQQLPFSFRLVVRFLLEAVVGQTVQLVQLLLRRFAVPAFASVTVVVLALM